MKTLQNRYQLASLLPTGGYGVEVGVARGDFSFTILRLWPGGTMTLIDPWAILHDEGFSGHGEDTAEGQEARYREVLAEAAKFNGRAVVLRGTSESEAHKFEDGSLQFCYLDAQHNYDSIKRDLEIWFPKLKVGSEAIFAGHDFLSGIHNGQPYGVEQAVTEFARERGLEVNVIQEAWPSWYLKCK